MSIFKTVDIIITDEDGKNVISSTDVIPHNIVLFSYKNNNLNLTTDHLLLNIPPIIIMIQI